MAPTAQERLLALERINAPPIEQIQQASLFAGISIIEISVRDSPAKPLEVTKATPKVGSHGRQEYVLRWLLKKLQDEETRCCAAAWRLLKRLTDLVPPRNLARILHERKFVLVLRQALEEALAARSSVNSSSDTVISSPITEKPGSASSKKRDSDGNLLNHVTMVNSVVEKRKVFGEWKLAVYEAVNHITLSLEHGPYTLDTSGSAYVKSTIRTSNVDAARILGAWLALCGTQNETVTIATEASLLPPFLEIWDTRILGPEDVKVFARYCLSHSVEIISTSGQQSECTTQLERLLARNILIPAKKAYGSSQDANSLASLVGDVVSKNPESAPTIFNIAIRCIQPHGPHSRTADDTAWLHTVIGALQEAISRNMSGESVDALNKMLRHCIDRKVALELPFLRLITSQYCLLSGSTNWDLLATIIELDSNTFLIPSDTEDLLKEILVRITDAGAETTWPTMVDLVVDKALAPLMGEFSKARQLTAFIHHWYDQLAEFDKFLRRSRKPVEHFTAWEDEALRVKLKELLEPSLTTLQIVEIVAWLVGKLEECEGVVCVLLDAVAGAVSQDETKAALYRMLKEEVINILAYTGPDDRYKARLLHLNTIVLSWSEWQNFDDVFPEEDEGNSPLLLKLISSEISFPDRDHSLTALEAFRYLCSQWSIGALRFQDHLPGTSSSDAVRETLSSHVSSVGSHIKKVVEQLPEVRKLVEQRWEGRIITIKRDLAWLACAYASCILVEHPQVLELCMEGQILTDFIWISSTIRPASSLNIEDPWLPLSHPGFPSMWIRMLRYDGYVENNKKLSQHIINRMIECATHSGNPIEGSKAPNGFVVMCFHHLPLELLSKYNREAIFKAWPPEPFDPSLVDRPSLLYKMPPLDSTILSLKAKMFKLPTLYNGIDIRELVDIAKCIELSRLEPKMQLDIYAEIPELILSHVFATIDQPKSRKYIEGAKETLGAWLEENRNTKKVVSYAMICLVQVVLTIWKTNFTSDDEFSMDLKETTKEFLTTFRGLLLSNLQLRLKNPAKLTQDDGDRCMSLYSTMDALDAITIGDSDLINLQVYTLSTLDSLKRLNSELGKRFDIFMTEHYPDIFGESPKKLLKGDVSTYAGREVIRRKALAVAKRMKEPEKLQLVNDLLDELGDEEALDKLLALKHVIYSCEDSRAVALEDDDLVGGLSTSYSSLAIKLVKSTSFRRCRLICELMVMILREKPRTITQYNIDTTLASITIICSRDTPILNPSSASTIYYGLVNLANAILINHRLKLQGHFHIVIQAIQSLLYCLFIPSFTGTNNSTKIHSFPPWITAGTGTGTGSLGAAHARVFIRLLTLICDPSVSAVSRPSSSSLNSATKKAKALAGQHMPFVLSAYIRAQLDMSLSMKQEIREALVPGWYAIFDTMTVEGRKALGEGMDASGRAILSGLLKDWLRFGKWTGA